MRLPDVDSDKYREPNDYVSKMYVLAKKLRLKAYWHTALISSDDTDYTVRVAVSSAFELLADEIDQTLDINTELTSEELRKP